MKNIVDLPDRKAIETEACAWIAQLDGGAQTEEDIIALQEWISRSPQHLEEIRRLSRLWGELDILTKVIQDCETSNGSSADTNSFFQDLFAPANAALVTIFTLLLVVATSLIFRHYYLDSSVWQVLYATEIGQQKTITLKDGSRVRLNTDSVIDVDFNQQHRKVRLVKGEVLFEVAHNELPFVVYVGTNIVRAVGTAFVVHLMQDKIQVTVTEGKVELISIRDGEQSIRINQNIAPSSLVTAKQTVTIDNVIREPKDIEEDEIDRKLAWRSGLIVFTGEPLSYVVEEVSRYTQVKLVISDPELGKLSIGGSFRVGEVNALIEALETGFGVDTNRINDEVIYLTQSPRR